eukprot:4095692-Alexandrium_andersonii.AAC.1
MQSLASHSQAIATTEGTLSSGWRCSEQLFPQVQNLPQGPADGRCAGGASREGPKRGDPPLREDNKRWH